MKPFLCFLVGFTAPIVTLVYRKGWYNTPDDPDSPHGQIHGEQIELLKRWGVWINDYVWLGWRNKAFGFAYLLKPKIFKDMTGYKHLKSPDIEVKQGKFLRTITILGYKEYCLSFKWFHILYGYRLRPIVSSLTDFAPYRPINMDARPLISIRAGEDT